VGKAVRFDSISRVFGLLGWHCGLLVDWRPQGKSLNLVLEIERWKAGIH
jgi:hypothetical protein